MIRRELRWIEFTVFCVALSVGMYVLMLRNATVISKVDKIRTEIRQELVEELSARIDSVTVNKTFVRLDQLSAKIDSLRAEIRGAE